VRCAAGTYIRSLAHDIGLQLGCGAHLSHLVRLSSGRFTIEESVELKEMVNAITNGYWDQYVYPPDEAVLDMKAVLINEEQVRRLSHGLSWPAKHFDGDVQLARAYDANGKLLGLARRRKSNWWPYKVLV
jgi:tRNA pseudouridine55 synthase